MTAPLYADRRRARSFGEDAALYDRVRPRYPDALFDLILEDRPGQVLDVGCSTGIASRQLAERGCDVLGIEPDLRMAALARSSGIAVELATFESWEPKARRF